MESDIRNKKVLILYNKLFHYRIPIFKLLAEKCDLTVAYSIGENRVEGANFNIVELPIIKCNRFVVHKDNIFKLCQNFDVVIAYGDIAWLKYSTLPWRINRKFKIIFWTIGVSASYNKSFDKNKRWDHIRNLFYKKSDALLFYSEYPRKKYIEQGYDNDKIFVAPNTVEVFNTRLNIDNKKRLLFIGTLYMQKGLLSLLESYKAVYLKNKEIPLLSIVGGGVELDNVKDWIESNCLSEKIILHGPIYDIKEKAKIFESAIACISPNQAGLSVLESMGYGVPFVTNKDSITGGERFNIENEINGILLDSPDQLREVIFDISENSQKYIQMGINAKKHYEECRKPIDMANGIVDAIKFVLK